MEFTCSRIVLGTQRSGSTALSKYVDAHPQLSLGRHKELHFFDRWYARIPTAPARRLVYRLKFPVAAGKHLVDITPAYTFWPGAVESIAQTIADARVVLVLRSPVARAVSHWRLETSRNAETLSFGDAIRLEPGRLDARSSLRPHSYVARGFYDLQVERVYRELGRENTLLLRSEDLRNDPTAALSQLWRHFGVEDIAPESEIIDHVSPISFVPEPADVAFLLSQFAPSIKRLEETTGWDLSAWRDPARAATL